ncbi:MAG: ABC transporter permease subunit [Gemmataceae bacterium]
MLGPIFTRELTTVPRKQSHYASRVAQLGLLTILGITAWQASVGFTTEATLGEAARFGMTLFQIVVFVQLLLLIFFAMLSAVSAVSQEKDRRTFILLLITDMHDYEIVLGKLLGSLLPITALMLTAVPFSALLLLLGGIDPRQVIESGIILLAASYAAGSLGGLIALWRERTFQAVALSVLFLVLYECATILLGEVGTRFAPQVDWLHVRMWIDPFVSMYGVLEPPSGGWSFSPAYGFGLVMLGFCIVLNGIGLWGLRRWNPSGEAIMQREGKDVDPEANLNPEELAEFRAKAHAAPGQTRPVWKNPILWREICTRAYGRRPLVVKLAFGLVAGLILLFAYTSATKPGGPDSFTAAFGLVPMTILSMLLVAAQSATSITSERDGGTLDVLLVTEVSPFEFVFGKLLGVIYNTKEFILPPLLFAIGYGIFGLYIKSPPESTNYERFVDNFSPLITVFGAIIVLLAFCCALGLHVALRIINSRLAILQTLGTVFFLSIGTMISIYMIVVNGGNFANQWLSFIAFLSFGIGGLWFVLSADRPSPALTLGSVLCPVAMFYCLTNILIAKPGTDESADPLVPFLTIAVSFGFTIYAILFPLVTEFDVALGRTTAAYEE